MKTYHRRLAPTALAVAAILWSRLDLPAADPQSGVPPEAQTMAATPGVEQPDDPAKTAASEGPQQWDLFGEWLVLIREFMPRWDVRADATWLADSDEEDTDQSVGMQEYRFRFSYRFKIIDTLDFAVGSTYQYRDIDAPASLNLPDQLHSVSADLALLYRPIPRLLATLIVNPGVRGELDEADGDDFRIPITAAVAYTFNKHFTLMGGLIFSANRHRNRAFPLIGLLWWINEHWTLWIAPLSPSVVYRPVPKILLTVGGQFTGGDYGLDEDVRGAESVIYRDYRVRAGVGWIPVRWLRLDVSGGYAFARRFSFFEGTRDGEDIDLDPAPFANAGITLRW